MRKIALGVIAALGLGATAAATWAHPGERGESGAMGHHAQGMQHGRMGGMDGGAAGRGAGHGGMTPEERTAFMEKMRAAKTPEERHQVAAANRAGMQKRAQERGGPAGEHRGPHGHGRAMPGGPAQAQ
jgi:hypothetical protein